MRIIRGKLTYANVMATVAVFIALGGGAYAAIQLAKNSVGTKQLKRGAVTGKKVRNATLEERKLTARAIAALKGRKGDKGARGPKGDTGKTGAPGTPGATNVLTRFGNEESLETAHGNGSYAACQAGEAVTGGGYEFFEGNPENPSYTIAANRPSNQDAKGNHPVPADGAKPSGWLVAMTNLTGSTFKFRAYAMCASP